MRAAVKDAVAFQRELHVKEEDDAMVEIKKEGGEIVELTPAEHQKFVDAVKPIYGEARGQFDRELLSLAKL
jgi:TRAP-type C4-dicarboxylate transport system substrate-binding protein